MCNGWSGCHAKSEIPDIGIAKISALFGELVEPPDNIVTLKILVEVAALFKCKRTPTRLTWIVSLIETFIFLSPDHFLTIIFTTFYRA